LLTLLPGEHFAFGAETAANARPDADAAALPAGEAERIIQALERGEDIGDQLDPTAAGLDGGGNNTGNGFVRLLRIVEGGNGPCVSNSTPRKTRPRHLCPRVPVSPRRQATQAPRHRATRRRATRRRC
jgi:hypothetical protein